MPELLGTAENELIAKHVQEALFSFIIVLVTTDQ